MLTQAHVPTVACLHYLANVHRQIHLVASLLMLFHLVKIYSELILIFVVYQRIQVAYYIVAHLMDVLVSYHLQDFYPLVYVTIKKV